MENNRKERLTVGERLNLGGETPFSKGEMETLFNLLQNPFFKQGRFRFTDHNTLRHRD